MSFRNTSFIHRPSQLRGGGRYRMNAQYFEECSKLARKRTDAYLYKRLLFVTEKRTLKEVV